MRKITCLLAIILCLAFPYALLGGGSLNAPPATDQITRFEIVYWGFAIPVTGNGSAHIHIDYVRASGAVANGGNDMAALTTDVLITSPTELLSLVTQMNTAVAGETGKTVANKLRMRIATWLVANGKITGVTVD